jgi:hypothetical protein
VKTEIRKRNYALSNCGFNLNFSFELRLRVSLSMDGDLSLISRVRILTGSHSVSHLLITHTSLFLTSGITLFAISSLLYICFDVKIQRFYLLYLL